MHHKRTNRKAKTNGFFIHKIEAPGGRREKPPTFMSNASPGANMGLLYGDMERGMAYLKVTQASGAISGLRARNGSRDILLPGAGRFARLRLGGRDAGR